MIRIRNGELVALRDVPVLGVEAFRDAVVAEVGAGARIAALFGRRRR